MYDDVISGFEVYESSEPPPALQTVCGGGAQGVATTKTAARRLGACSPGKF